MKIIDCFGFYNEWKMLEYRIGILNEFVDEFILIESTKTFAGNDKVLTYEENKHLLSPEIRAKIKNVVVDDFIIPKTKQDFWVNEMAQRDCISAVLDPSKYSPDDIVMICDVDEIPNPELLNAIKTKKIILDLNILFALRMDMYYYDLRHKQVTEIWDHAKIMSMSYFSKNSKHISQQIRLSRNYRPFPKAGWHLSYFGDAAFIANKIKQFAHQEFNLPQFTNEEAITNRIHNGVDLFDRQNGIQIIELKDNTFLPPFHVNLLCTFF